ncbi:DUF721 domain-containing protein [uncultured Pseudokineococcus sp.]|uniref:DUF721 domain-containing protein n=1 Tax=uncultured Pseudokineococcus sp. TaxID=1642928 RepID=UPI0026105FD5|nr:DciA family protein [uncultured Pseudokineococcus sp.]
MAERPGEPEPPEPPGGPGGPPDPPADGDAALSADPSADAVRAALGRARAAARARGVLPGAPGSGGKSSDQRRREERRRRGTAMSGAGPDDRDPQTVGRSVDRLVGELGWSAPVAVGGVVGRWEQVVGPEVAAHATPERFADGVLVVRADSTAWATQLRLLEPVIARRLDEELGAGVVVKLQVRGPGAPSWRRGPRRAPGGRGPRDTYG